MTKTTRFLLAGIGVMLALTFTVVTQAGNPGGKAPSGKFDPKEQAAREAELRAKYRDFQDLLLTLKQQLDRTNDKKQTELLTKVLELDSKLAISTRFEEMVKTLSNPEALKRIGDLQNLEKESFRLAGDLKQVLDLLRDGTASASKKDERLALEKLVKELERIIRDQKTVIGKIEANADKKDTAQNQRDVRKDTKDLGNKLAKGEKGDGKGGEAKESKGDAKEGKGKGAKGESKDKGKAGEGAKPGDSKNKGKGEGQEGSAKAGNKGGDPKGGDQKGGAKGGEAGDPKDSKGGAKGGEGEGGKGSAGKGGEGEGGKGGAKGGEKGGEKDGDKGKAKPDGDASKVKQKGQEGAAKKNDGKQGEKQAGGAKGGDKQGGDKQGGSQSKQGGQKQDQQGGAKSSSQSGQGGSKSSGQGGQGQEGQEGKQGAGKDDGQDGGKQGGGKEKDNPQSMAKKRIKEAEEAMRKAADDIEQARRKDGIQNAEIAREKLEEAKRKLEELLRQLREEELERLLADLKNRCQKMLAMQIAVYNATKALDRNIQANNDKKPTRVNTQDSLNLSDDEKKIVVEADKAIQVIEAEGTAVAFAEVFQQVREDMKHVQRRLGITDPGKVTQAIESDIIDTLQEMIKALEKAQQEQQQGKPKDGGQPPPNQDQKLLDQIAELKMIRAMQMRVNKRTELYGNQYEGEQARVPEIRGELRNLAERQERIVDVTNKIAKGDNK